MANTRIMLTLGGVFLAGVAVGMVGMRYGLHDRLHPPVAAAPVLASIPDKEELLERYRVELKLTPEQARELAEVLSDYQHYYQAVQEQIESIHLRDQIDDLRSTGKSRILEILDDEQRVKFERMTGTLDPQAPRAPK